MTKATRVRIEADGTETRSESNVELPHLTSQSIIKSVRLLNDSVEEREAPFYINFPQSLSMYPPIPLAPFPVIKGGRKAPKVKKSSYRPRLEGSMYLRQFLDSNDAKECIDNCVKALKTRLAINPDDFDAIAFTGMSGALIAPPIARRLGKSVIMVRKADDTSTHSQFRVDGDYNARRYIIIDDFRSTGDTEIHIRKQIFDHIGSKANYVGMLEARDVYENAVDRAIKLGKAYELTPPRYQFGLPTTEDV